MNSKFSQSLWQKAAPIYQKIAEHPFNIELTQGILDRRRFLFYLEQDAYYLIHFSKALAWIGGRAISSPMIHQFLHFSLEALVAERALHAGFLGAQFDSETIRLSPSCLAYTQHLMLTAATASLEEAVAAVLPCFWIYREIGRHIALHSTETNPYAEWIETYSSQEFSDSTDRAISLLDELATHSSSRTLERMRTAFERSALFEWYFWNDAYELAIFEELPQPISLQILKGIL